ncbi:NAD-dependent epimerase/dehydratase family protein [Telmatobacter sp. DSM 110680]|uniref:NAD-dependent epimerase/dehydratase family protein n=1 Tax=Telmatobacter sp. DSM 110680 TaxID=3036704 RepID=A0AAU7DEH8_9BACT
MSFESASSALANTFASRPVLVTGGAGFIGSHLVRRMVTLGSNVISLGGNREDAELVVGAHYIFGDISRDTLETVDFVPQTVFHLAGGASVAASVEDPPVDFLKTVFSTVLLLDYLRRRWPAVQLVYVSSAAIYGEAIHKEASHDLACLPLSPYGVHKRQVEFLLLDHARMYRTQSVILRPFSVYGPGLRKQLLWDAMQKTDRGDSRFFGSGRELRDWVFVSDLVECLLQASEYASADVPVFNAGTCRGTSVREVLSELFSVAGIDIEPKFLGQHKEGDPERLVADNSIEAVLGPVFRTPLRTGLGAYVEWYRQRGVND